MRIVRTPLPGCHVLELPGSADDRGSFAKTYHAGHFARLGLEATNAECFHSTSARGVIRGLHFQAPPSDHAKVVCCLAGAILDAVVDLRVGSPAFGQHATLRLSGGERLALYIPRGLAHGFAALSADALVAYHTSSVHDPERDQGVRWDSAGIEWGLAAPLVSPRDAAFPALATFASPFRWPTGGT
jgi:dTDP-4-dehydrorhamnose 3,5-epimerase